jgi:hypothetical protein
VRKLLRKVALAVPRIMAPGATLNARSELERAAEKVTELDAQLRRVNPPTTPSSTNAA